MAFSYSLRQISCDEVAAATWRACMSTLVGRDFLICAPLNAVEKPDHQARRLGPRWTRPILGPWWTHGGVSDGPGAATERSSRRQSTTHIASYRPGPARDRPPDIGRYNRFTGVSWARVINDVIVVVRYDVIDHVSRARPPAGWLTDTQLDGLTVGAARRRTLRANLLRQTSRPIAPGPPLRVGEANGTYGGWATGWGMVRQTSWGI